MRPTYCKTVITAFIISLFIGLACTPVFAGPRSGRVKAFNSIVQVTVETTMGTTRRCSGYLFSSAGQVVTTFHSVSDARSITVFHVDHGVFEVSTIMRTSPRADIAVLQLANAEQLNVSCAQMADTRGLKAGEIVHVLHHPSYQDESRLDTVVQSIGYARQYPSNYFLDNYAPEILLLELPGNFDAGSAGGIVCDQNYNVIGVVLAGLDEGDGSRGAYAISATYFNDLLISSTRLKLDSLATGSQADADYFDRFLGPAPQPLHYQAGMPEGYLIWFSPVHHTTYDDDEFTSEINDKVDKNWFYTSDLMIDRRPLREWSFSRIYVWPAAINSWGIENSPETYVHFDADSQFSKLIYKDRETEERIMTRHLCAMPLMPGSYVLQYENLGANYKSTGTKQLRLEVQPAEMTLIDITGLSLVSMQLLEQPVQAVGEAKPVRYELERHQIGEKELNAGIRHVRFPLEQ